MLSVVFRRALRNVALATCALALAGCSMFSSSSLRHEPSELTQYPAAISARQVWSVSVGKGSGYGFAPTVVNESVYAATPDGSVIKVALASGQIVWQANPGVRLSAGAGSDGITTAVAAADGSVIAFNDQGTEKWKAKATSEVNIPPAVGGGVVVVRSGDYRIQAFDAESGDLRWSVQRPGPALALKTSMQMLIVDGLLITGLPNGKLMAVDAASGNVQWEGTVSVSQGATDLERISDVVGAPQIQGPVLCGVTYQGRMACFDVSQGGRTVWTQNFSSNSGMTTDPVQAYAPNQRDIMAAFSLESGTEVWKQEALRNRSLSAPAVVPEAVAVGDFEGYVHFLSRDDGRLLGRLNVGGGAILSPLTGTARGILVQTGAGNLVLVGLN